MSFRRLPSASSNVDPVDFEAYARVPNHRLVHAGADERHHHGREQQIMHKARTRDVRALLNLRSKTAVISKGVTTGNPVEAAMRERAEESAHTAAERQILQMKRRLAINSLENFAKADQSVAIRCSVVLT